MKRFSFFLEAEQIDFLRSLSGNVSEHLRRAIEDYKKKTTPKAIVSPSKKGGDNHG